MTKQKTTMQAERRKGKNNQHERGNTMTKKNFIALADHIKQYNQLAIKGESKFTHLQINRLAEFCEEQNPRFDRERWLAYIAGECGQNGGRVK